MLNLGDVPAGSVLPIPFDTFAAAGESITMSGFAVTDIECYGGTSMTQRASDNGVALLDSDGTDLDSLTGIQGFSIDLSDNSDSGFWAIGTRYRIVVSTITVDSKTVSFTAAVFRIVPAEAVAGKPKVDVDAIAGQTASASGTVTFPNATLQREIWSSASATVNLSGTTVKTATDVEADTQDLQARLPAALTGDGNMKVDVLKIEGADPTDTLTTAATAATPTVTLADGAITNAKLAADSGLKPIRSGTAQGGSANMITLDASASSVTDYYNNTWVYTTGGTGAGQSKLITGYNGTTKVATVAVGWALGSAPDNTTTFAILPAAWVAGVDGMEAFFDSYIGAAGAALTDLGGMSTTMRAQVQSEVADELTLRGYSSTLATNLAARIVGTLASGTHNPQSGDAYAVVNSGTHGNAALKVLIDAIDLVVDAILADTETDGVALSAAVCNKIADHVKRRTQANTEASSDGDALSLGSMYGFVQQAQESSVSGGTMTVKQTDGVTTLGTKTIASDGAAEPIVSVS